MISYTLKPGRAEENERYVAAVFEALEKVRPKGLRYATFRQGDGLVFTHFVAYEEAVSADTLTALPEFKAFVAGIKDRCDVPPARVELTEIGSYGFFRA